MVSKAKLQEKLNEKNQIYLGGTKVSVQGVVALFATLCRELDFYEGIFFFIINFQKEKANAFTVLIIYSYSEKSSNLLL